jgi:hypothetical protein
MIYLILILMGIIIIFLFLIQYRLVLSNYYDNDAYSHIRIAREISKQKKLPKKLGFFVAKKPVNYTLPPLLHLILAPFSKMDYKKLILFPNIINLLITLEVFFIISLKTSTIELAFFGAAIYLLTRINTVGTSSLTPRQLGLLFLTAYIFSLEAFFSNFNYIFLVVNPS